MSSSLRTDAPDEPDARVLALDIGLYGHVGSLASFFWYRTGGRLHAHATLLAEPDDNLDDQLALLEAWAESFPEYRYLSPVVVIGTTVLSHVGRQTVREQLSRWLNPPHRRRLLNIGDYAGEQAGARGLVPRKKLRDLLLDQMSRRALTLTDEQRQAITLYTGKRAKPSRDPDDDGWRLDETDALALPVAHACFATRYLLPPPIEDADALDERMARYARAWQLERDVTAAEAQDRAWSRGHPQQQHQPERRTGVDEWRRPVGAHARRKDTHGHR